MLLAGLLLGVFLGVTIAVVFWAAGRRPWLRVDVNEHHYSHTTRVVHHYPTYLDSDDGTGTGVVEGRVVNRHHLPPALRRHRALPPTATTATDPRSEGDPCE